RKLGKYMERKVRKTEKISSILTINIKIELIFFLRKNYCPTLFYLFLHMLKSLARSFVPSSFLDYLSNQSFFLT
ncbi:IS5/IS1182 family transposase, partial [Enterococcus hirae]